MCINNDNNNNNSNCIIDNFQRQQSSNKEFSEISLNSIDSSTKLISNSAIINMAQNIVSKEPYYLPKETSCQFSGDFSHLVLTDINEEPSFFNNNNNSINTSRIKNSFINRQLNGSIYKKLNKSSKSLLKESQKEFSKKSRIPRLMLHNRVKAKNKNLNKSQIGNHGKKTEEKQFSLSSLLDINDNSITNKDLMQYQIKLYNFLKQRKNLSKNGQNINTNELYTNLNNEISPNESLHLFHQFTGYRHVDSPLKKMINSSPRNLDKCTNSTKYSIKPKNIRVSKDLKIANIIPNNLNNSNIANDSHLYNNNNNININIVNIIINILFTMNIFIFIKLILLLFKKIEKWLLEKRYFIK